MAKHTHYTLTKIQKVKKHNILVNYTNHLKPLCFWQVGWSTARDYYTFLWSPLPDNHTDGTAVNRSVVFQGKMALSKWAFMTAFLQWMSCQRGGPSKVRWGLLICSDGCNKIEGLLLEGWSVDGPVLLERFRSHTGVFVRITGCSWHESGFLTPIMKIYHYIKWTWVCHKAAVQL